MKHSLPTNACLKQLVPVLTLLGLIACGPAEFSNPFTPLTEAIADARLEGQWCSSEDDEDGWLTFAEASSATPAAVFYQMTIVEPNSDTPEEWAVWLGRLGDDSFINVTWTMDPMAAGGYMFGRVRFEDDRLRVALVESDWAKRWARAMGFDTTGSSISAPADALKWLAREFADDDRVFSDTYEFVRASPDSGCTPSSLG